MFLFDREKHFYTLDGRELPSVTGILKAEGFINTRFYDEWSRARGEYVHTMTHLYDQGELDEDTLDPQLVPYLEAWKKFLKESSFQVIDSEIPLYHPQLLYAGTPDKVGLLNDQLTILDNKSGTLESWVSLQLAGYEILKGSPHKRVAVRLKPDGTYNLKEFKDRQDRDIFLAALACYQWKKNNLRRT